MHYTFIFLAKTHNPILIMSKISDKPHLRDVLQNTWPGLLKTVSHQEEGKPERLSQPRGDLMTECGVVPGWDPGAEKGHQVKPKEI